MSGLDRRQFLKVIAGAGGALIVGLPLRAAYAEPPPMPLDLLGDTWTRLNAFVSIEPNGRTLIGARAPDIGQGVRTALPRIIADELDADWARVEVIPLPLGVEDNNGKPQWVYGPQHAGGSRNIPEAWQDLRAIGAAARWLLRTAAAQRWNLPADRLQCRTGWVLAPDGRRLDYGELASAAAQLQLPDGGVAPKAPSDYQLIGQPAGDVDAAALVTGRLQFAIDQSWGDGYVAVIARCPYPDGELAHLDDTAARAVDGVEKVIPLDPRSDTRAPLGDAPLVPGVAVLARDTWSALKGRAQLALRWRARSGGDASTDTLAQQATASLKGPPTTRVRQDGDFDKAFHAARHRIEAEYRVPFVAHATMEPMNCMARITSDRAHLIAPTQDPRRALGIVQKLTGLDPGQILVELPRIGGGYGRRLDDDWVAEAVLLAQAAGKPVKLMWTREDDTTHDLYRPFGVHRLAAGLDRKGHVDAWRHHLASTSRLWRRGVADGDLWRSELPAGSLPAGLVPNLDLGWYALDFPLWRGPWRAPSQVSNVFASESFLDEIAHATRQDPLKLRLSLLEPARQFSVDGTPFDSGRLAAVLKQAAEAIDWDKHAPYGHGRGLACAFSAGGYCAHAFEVSLQGGRLRFHRVVAVVDVGRVVNPLGLDAQIMAGTLDGISTAMKLAITVKDGAVRQRNFPDYPIARMNELPRTVDVIQVASESDPMGAEDLGVPGAAPALANAIFAATGRRLRSMPFAPALARAD